MKTTIIIFLVAPFVIAVVAYWIHPIFDKDQPEEEPVQAPELPIPEKEKPEIEPFQAPHSIALEKELPAKEPVHISNLPVPVLEKESTEKQAQLTPETPTLPYSICGIASCLMSVIFWIWIGLSAIAHEALQPKVKHFLLDPIGYTLERTVLIFLQPFVELAKASVIASGAGMLAALILGIIGLLESETDKSTALLGCVLSIFGLFPALGMLFSK